MKKKSLYVVMVIIGLFCLFSYFNVLEQSESSLQDEILQSRGEVDSRIVILGIDDSSLEKYGQWPWSRTYIAEAINKLSEGKVAAIGVDFIYSEETRNAEEDAKLVEAVRNAGNVIMPVYGNFGISTIKKGEMEPISVKEPFEKLKEVSILAQINTIPDSDGVVRKALTSFNYNGKQINSFAIEVYNQYLRNMSKADYLIETPKDGWNRTYITYTSQPANDGSIENFPIYKVLNGEIPVEYFKDKIVLIGPYAIGLGDAYFTPLDHGSPMYGVEIHGNIIQNLLNSNFKREVPEVIQIGLLILLGAICYIIFSKLKPVTSFIIGLLFISAYLLIGKFIFNIGFIIQLFYPTLLIIIIYIVMLVSNYISEYLDKKRIRDLFGRYVEPKVVNKILDGGKDSVKLGGERRNISVLFVDIRGFTPLSEKCEPEEIVEILNRYLDLTSKSIFNNLGTLDKFIGDATMAIFNAPLDLEDHAFKAVQAAWEMKQGADELQKELLEKYGRSVQFGIGVNTGYAVVGNIGSKMRMDYTAIGDTVNTSARLESNAKPGQILISQATYELVKGRVIVSDLGEIKVKGKEQGINIFQLEGVG